MFMMIPYTTEECSILFKMEEAVFIRDLISMRKIESKVY